MIYFKIEFISCDNVITVRPLDYDSIINES